jgi:alpha-1,6-mannosyltransferase
VVARTAARRFIHTVYDRFDVTVASSPSVARELRSLGVRRVEHISLGVALDHFRPDAPGSAPSREELGIAPGVPAGLYVGRFCAEKRLDVALEGHARIPLARRPHLVLVGGGPQREEMEARAAQEPRLTVLPYMSDRDALAALYASMDFYLAPGPGETFGLSIGEALASGLPVVTVDRGAGPDRVDGADVSTRYRHGDSADAARAVSSMARRVEREGDGLRRRARAHAEGTLDWNRTVERLLDLYRDLAEARPR